MRQESKKLAVGYLNSGNPGGHGRIEEFLYFLGRGLGRHCSRYDVWWW